MSTLAERITAYLSGGALFNPELANHDAVRDLLIDCRDALTAPSATVPSEKIEDAGRWLYSYLQSDDHRPELFLAAAEYLYGQFAAPAPAQEPVAIIAAAAPLTPEDQRARYPKAIKELPPVGTLLYAAPVTPPPEVDASWISVKERTPDPFSGKDVFVARGDKVAPWVAAALGFSDSTWTERFGITHWMPIPALPPVPNSPCMNSRPAAERKDG